MKTITVIRTSDLSLPHSVRSYIDGCAYEYSVTDDWTKIAQLAYRLKRGANLLPDFLEDYGHENEMYNVGVEVKEGGRSVNEGVTCGLGEDGR